MALGTHGPAEGYKMLLETGPAGQTELLRLQGSFRWIPPQQDTTSTRMGILSFGQVNSDPATSGDKTLK